VLRIAALLLIVVCPAAGAEGELTGRWRVFAARAFLPADDLGRALDDTPRDQAIADLRLTWSDGQGPLDYEVALELGAAYDTDGQAYGPDRRALDLGRQQSLGADLDAAERLDRLWIGTELGAWRVTLGRQAASFSGGLVSSPWTSSILLASEDRPRLQGRRQHAGCSPAPSTTAASSGFFGVGRRGEGRDVHGDASSGAARWGGSRQIVLRNLPGMNMLNRCRG
jgi:hypothetical protein